jgi:hypothetical protein
MELKEFLQKFLQNYEQKRERSTIFSSRPISTEEFEELYFEEALQNFTDRICEEQRKICSDYYNNNQPYDSHENYIGNLILEAEQPKIEEL